MITIVSLLAASAISSGLRHLRLVSVWTLPYHIGVRYLEPISEKVAITEHGMLSLTDGSISATNNPATQQLPGTHRILDDWKMNAFFDTPHRKLAFNYKAPNGYGEVVEMLPGTKTVTRSLTLRHSFMSNVWVTGDSKGEFWAIGRFIEGSGRMTNFQDLIIPPLRISPLQFITYSDISRPTQGVLGVQLPKGKTYETVQHLKNTPTSPLALGDPLTGKVKWSNANFSGGRWLGKNYVLTSSPRAILDGETGKRLEVDVSSLNSFGDEFTIGGSFIIAYGDDKNGKQGTFCFELRED